MNKAKNPNKTNKWMATAMAALMLLALTACGGNRPTSAAPAGSESVAGSESTPTSAPTAAPSAEPTEAPSAAPAEVQNTPAATAQPTEAPTEGTDELVDGMRPEFKAAMDSYEEFYDGYCDFIAKYNENPGDLALLAEYANMLTKMNDMNKKFEEWEEEDMNDTETKYYIEVNSRITQKLVAASQSIQ